MFFRPKPNSTLHLHLKATHTLAAVFVLTSSAFAGGPGTAPAKQTVPLAPAPAPVYGEGWYGGLQLGLNAYQNFGGARQLNSPLGLFALEPREKLGFAGGIKLGYVFGAGAVRPAIEFDAFYAGVQGDLDIRRNGAPTGVNADADLNSGAFLVNFIVRFGTGRFQPYLGAGVGGYYAAANDVNVTGPGFVFQGNGGSGNAGLA